MDKNHYIFYIEGKEIDATLIDEGHRDPLNRFYYYYFEIQDQSNEAKYITIGISDLVLNRWQIEAPNEQLLAFCLQVLPFYIPLLYQDKKQQMTVILHRDENVQRKEGAIYFQALGSPRETAQKLLFTSNTPTNNQIRKEILSVCYAKWQTEPHGFVGRQELFKFIPVEEVQLERNLKYLVDSGYINSSLTSGGYMHAKITRFGIDLYENPEAFNRMFSIKFEQQTVNIGGDYIAPVIVGSNNQVAINSQITDAFKSIESEVEQSDIINKDALSREISDLKKELIGGNPNPKKVKSIMDKIKELAVGVHENILKHPIVAQIIAELLLRQIK